MALNFAPSAKYYIEVPTNKTEDPLVPGSEP